MLSSRLTVRQDMTAFIARNATETIAMVRTKADEPLTNWTINLSKEYISIPAAVFDLGPQVHAHSPCLEKAH